MEQLSVRSYNHTYPILIGKGIRYKLSKFLKGKDYSQLVIITDENVYKHYLNDITDDLNRDFIIKVFTVSPGEQAKSLKVYEEIQKYLLAENIDRSSAVIALGGGVIGDLAGFVASTYMRGISFIQVPTTLLAHDSSIGGKVAINLNSTKNVLGNFYSPDLVLYDTETFLTLSEKELRSGFAEMVKHGYLTKNGLLNRLKLEMNESINPMAKEFDRLLLESIKVKQKIVELDEFESNERKFLNLGHTLGHAIEAIKSYSHGECVMYGLLFCLYVSGVKKGQPQKFLDEDLLNWVFSLKYPLNLITKEDLDLLVNKWQMIKKQLIKQLILFY
ncbi:3-dehydroquinate synthase [Piscibacillus salipiscarius]|uniref:3-dehydroquinate synthase n=1 Tax=Piscibacillus salipiscarius TaxID=299480 RepID=UPI0006D046DE|nr:3-dehydroquinate synthase [Piscibacillus salipiscarius]